VKADARLSTAVNVAIIVEKMHAEGYPNFRMQDHTYLWQALDAKNLGRGYGTETESDGWRW